MAVRVPAPHRTTLEKPYVVCWRWNDKGRFTPLSIRVRTAEDALDSIRNLSRQPGVSLPIAVLEVPILEDYLPVYPDLVYDDSLGDWVPAPQERVVQLRSLATRGEAVPHPSIRWFLPNGEVFDRARA